MILRVVCLGVEVGVAADTSIVRSPVNTTNITIILVAIIILIIVILIIVILVIIVVVIVIVILNRNYICLYTYITELPQLTELVLANQ